MLYYVSPQASCLDLIEIRIRYALGLAFHSNYTANVAARVCTWLQSSHLCSYAIINRENILFPTPCNWRVSCSQLLMFTCCCEHLRTRFLGLVCKLPPGTKSGAVMWWTMYIYARGFPSRHHVEQKTIQLDRSVHGAIIPWRLSHEVCHTAVENQKGNETTFFSGKTNVAIIWIIHFLKIFLTPVNYI